MTTANDWYYRLYGATAEEVARCEAAWKRIKSRRSGTDPDAYQKTAACKLCGAACWDHFLVCGECDEKAPPAATARFATDGTVTVTSHVEGVR